MKSAAVISWNLKVFILCIDWTYFGFFGLLSCLCVCVPVSRSIHRHLQQHGEPAALSLGLYFCGLHDLLSRHLLPHRSDRFLLPLFSILLSPEKSVPVVRLETFPFYIYVSHIKVK